MPSKVVVQKTDKKFSKANHNGDYEKYLTEMKELGSDELEKEVQKKNEPVVENPNPHPVVEAQKENKPQTESVEKAKKESITPNLPVANPGNAKPYTKVDIILLCVNAIALISLFFILSKIPSKVDEYKKLRQEVETLSENPGLSDSALKQNTSKFEKISRSFLDKTSIVNFVNDIENIKSEGTSISKVNFTSENPVKDKTGNFGYPVIIELTGSWDKISEDLFSIEKLPYLFRPVKVETESSLSDGMILLKYGGILYVKDLGKN